MDLLMPRMQFRLPCTPRTVSHGCQIVYWDPVNAKQISPQKYFGIDYVKLHGLHGNPLYGSSEWGRPTKAILSSVSLILEPKLGVKLKLRHMPSTCCQICKSSNLKIHQY